MKHSKIKLSTNGLRNIPIIENREDFEFIVGESHHRCSSFMADFLSPKLSRLHAVDPTLESLVICTEDAHGYFKSFISLGRGFDISLDSSNLDFFRSLSSELENQELSFLIFEVTQNESELIRENVFRRLTDLSHFSFDISKEIAFIASHFHEISNSELSDLNFSILSDVLASRELQIESEERLYSVVWEFIESDRSHFNLLSFVRFEFLSVSSIRRFVALSNLRLISSICSIHRFGRV
jgi:hypothetical protein